MFAKNAPAYPSSSCTKNKYSPAVKSLGRTNLASLSEIIWPAID
jgi:hypothetical protein